MQCAYCSKSYLQKICSNKNRCKFGTCSNKAPCKKPYFERRCNCKDSPEKIQPNSQDSELLLTETDSTQQCETCGTPFITLICSNKQKCKLGDCSNKYPCKKKRIVPDCECEKIYSLSQVDISYQSQKQQDFEKIFENNEEEIFFPTVAEEQSYPEKSLTNWLIKYPPLSFPNLILNQWDVVEGFSHEGQGDLVFSNNEESEYAVVEVKYLTTAPGKSSSVSRRRHKQQVIKQATTYSKHWIKRTGKKTIAFTLTNDGLQEIKKYTSESHCLIHANKLDQYKRCWECVDLTSTKEDIQDDVDQTLPPELFSDPSLWENESLKNNPTILSKENSSILIVSGDSTAINLRLDIINFCKDYFIRTKKKTEGYTWTDVGFIKHCTFSEQTHCLEHGNHYFRKKTCSKRNHCGGKHRNIYCSNNYPCLTTVVEAICGHFILDVGEKKAVE